MGSSKQQQKSALLFYTDDSTPIRAFQTDSGYTTKGTSLNLSPLLC